MKLLFTLITLLFVATSFGKPQVYFNYKLFHTPDQKAFVSTSLQFISGSFKYKGDGNGNLNAQVEITQIFSKDEKIIIADKYVLDSPLMKDSTVDDFYDVQRYALEPGFYNYELVIKDLLSGEEVKGEQMIEVGSMDKASVVISDIEFIEDAYKTDEQNNFTKSGFFILPYLTNYFPPEITKIAFYAEVYNSSHVLGEGEQFLITCDVSHYSTGRKVAGIFKHQRMNTGPVSPTIMFVPIETLPSGDYNLNVNVINKANDTLTTKQVFFQRRNDILPEEIVSIQDIEIDPSFKQSINWDSIPYFLGSLMPISERYEYETIRKMLKGTDTTFMEKYFYAYWKETNSIDPQREWKAYKLQVQYTEKLFGTQIKFGWETDRGRIHLKYGSPNQMVDRPNEPSAYPYQIWHYYRIGQRSNIRFVFYNPDLVTNDYPMLHSDMQGELQNYRWEADLHKRDTPNTSVDDPGGSVHFGGSSGTLFRD
ncbi:MAG: GWxTD domain-containing protein [Crocinitomix sp.]|nr:GWxTD domain-containing protein [Crocinitomix sp.]